MRRKIYIDGQLVTIDPNDTLGAGGQATVIKHDNLALKLWRQPDPLTLKKVSLLLRKKLPLPPQILQPQVGLTDSPAGQLIGYGMPLLPSDFRELAVLFNRRLRIKQDLRLPLVLDIIEDAAKVLEQIHPFGVVGDLSGRNVAFVTTPTIKTFWYDLDSWALNGYPCPVWTDFFIDPRFYPEIDRGKLPSFDRLGDWYSLSVILFWSIFYSHPYQGNHSSITTLKDRATRGLWLFDSKVTLPSMAASADIATDELLHYFESLFVKGKREILDQGLLSNYAKSLIKCSACDSLYPSSRPRCPQCSLVSPVTAVLIKLSTLIQSQGEIVFSRFQAGKLFAITRKKGRFFLLIRSQADPVEEISLPHLPADTRFEIVGDQYLVASLPDTEVLTVYNLKDLRVPTLVSTTTFSGNRKTVFRGTSRKLLRIASRQLLAGEITPHGLIERQLPIQVSPNQTWFWADPDREVVVGVTRAFDLLQFWLIVKDQRFEFQLEQLPQGESQLDLAVKFSDKSIMLRRLTKSRGKSYIRTEVFDLTGQSLLNLTKEASSYPTDQIHGLAYDHLKVWLPTDQGIVLEDLKSGTFSLIAKTARAVSSADSLHYLGKDSHFLVIRSHQIDYLVLP